MIAMIIAATLMLSACGGRNSVTQASGSDANSTATAAVDHSAHAEHAAPAGDAATADHSAQADGAAHADQAAPADYSAHAEHATAAATEATAHAHDHSAESLPTTPLAELSGSSLYHLSSSWTDQHQGRVALPDLAGGPAVVVMFYGDCTTACPLLVKTAEDIEAALPEDLRDITRFVMVSFDTERDTPAKLLEYAASKGLDRDGWHWLVGSPLQTRQLATMLGVQFRDAGNGVFAHSNVVSVLDAGGVPVARLEGLGGDLDAAIDAINAAAGSES